MTIEEARKVLDGELLVLTLENNVANEAQKKRLNEKFAALNVAISALDKQIPKKPISLPDGHPFYYKIHDCPFCEESVYVAEGEFCPSCGQALDWSDSDD